MNIEVEEITRDNRTDYEHYILTRDDSSFVDSWGWREVLEQVYELPNFWYVARENRKIVGSLCLTLSSHRIFGRYLCTAPFANQGGFYWDSEGAFSALLNKAGEIQKHVKAKYTVIRHLKSDLNPPPEWQQNPSYATYHLPLNADPEIFLRKHLRAKKRNQVTKSMTQGSHVKFGKLELLDDFWYVISHSMRELGSPYHSKFYLLTLMEIIDVKTEFVIVYSKDSRPVGGGLLIRHHDHVVLLHANVLREYRHTGAGDFLYWSFISEYCRRGTKLLDLGRSLVGSGNEHYKMRWRPIRHMLAYWYRLSPGQQLPELNQSSPRFQLAIKMWQRQPLWLARLAGPRLISGIL